MTNEQNQKQASLHFWMLDQQITADSMPLGRKTKKQIRQLIHYAWNAVTCMLVLAKNVQTFTNTQKSLRHVRV